REDLRAPEIARAVEGARCYGGQAARPHMGGSQVALRGVRVDAVDVRLARPETEVCEEVERAHVKGAVGTLGDTGRSRVTDRIVRDEGDDAIRAVGHDLAQRVGASVHDVRADGVGGRVFRYQHPIGVGIWKFLPQVLVLHGPGVLLVADVAPVGRHAGRAVEAVQMTDLRKGQTGRGCV